jgi:hypothetical protein
MSVRKPNQLWCFFGCATKMYQIQILFIIERDGMMIMGNKSVVTPFQGINVSGIKDPLISHRRYPVRVTSWGQQSKLFHPK